MDTVTPATTLAVENTPYTLLDLGKVLRLRMSVQLPRLPLSTGDGGFKLQYATSVDGTWVDLGLPASGQVWRGFDNPSVAHGATFTSTLLSLSSVPESYQEQNPSPANPNLVPTKSFAEWDWAIQENGAAFNTTYYFRMVDTGDEPFGSYTRLPSLVMPPPLTLDQSDYRWYANVDSIEPTTALAGEHAPHTGAAHGQYYRLRMNLAVDGLNLSTGDQAFKLQSATGIGGPWTDIGSTGSAAAWRFTDNPSVTDGATLTAPLVSGSSVAQSYQESNPSPTNPKLVSSGQKAEWDWALQDNGATGDTTFFFRTVKSDDTPLDSYSFYPELNTPPPPVLAQQDYRWYDNANAITPTTSLAGENTPFTGAVISSVVRLRMNLGVTVSNLATGEQTFKLQFATSTGGAWTDVGALGSGAQWRGFDNASVVDGASLPSTVLSLSDVAETYEEVNPSGANPRNVEANQRAEFDWVVQNSTSSPNTYFFRMVTGDGTPLDSYVNYPEIETSVPVLGQQDHRWYANVDNVTPTTPLGAENTPVTGSTPLQVLRLRINLDATGLTLPASIQDFKLQYSVNTGSGPWTDVGSVSSTSIWRAFDNPSVSSGSAIVSLLLSSSNVLETYEETNPSALNPNPVPAGQKGEWDWAVQNNSAATGTYYFRLVRGDGSALESYLNYPSVVASGPTFTQRDYRWYSNVNSATPTTPLAAENTPFTGDSPGIIYRLRMNLELGGQNLPTGAQAFRLQFSTSTGGSWTDVGALGSANIWRGADNATPIDGATITTLLTPSNAGESYEEANDSIANPNAFNIGQRAEWDWVVQDNAATADTTYYFRMVRNDASELESYPAFPTITTPPPLVLTQDVYRWYDNRNNITPNTPLVAENTPATGIAPATEVRLRVNVGATGATLESGLQAFKLQFSTSTGGGWTDVGAISSGSVWEGFNNGNVADGATVTSLLLTASDAAETYEESNPSVSAPNAIAASQHGEWDWVLRYTSSQSNWF